MPTGRLVGFGLIFAFSVCGWGQTTDGPPAVDSRDRSAANTTPPARPQGDWRRSPFENAPYAPLSVKDKVYLFSWRTIQPSSFAKSAFTAGIAHWRDKPEEWGQGMAGYGRRYGHRLINRAVESGIGLGVTTLMHQDPRYYRNPDATVGRRVLHALSQVVVTRTDSGGKTFSVWRFAGNYGGQFVSNAWRPERQHKFSDTMLRGTFSLSFDAASNVFKEFWPDIRRRVLKR